MFITQDLSNLIEIGNRYGDAIHYTEDDIQVRFGYKGGTDTFALGRASICLNREFRVCMFQPVQPLHNSAYCHAYAGCWDQYLNFKREVELLGYRIQESE